MGIRYEVVILQWLLAQILVIVCVNHVDQKSFCKRSPLRRPHHPWPLKSLKTDTIMSRTAHVSLHCFA